MPILLVLRPFIENIKIIFGLSVLFINICTLFLFTLVHMIDISEHSLVELSLTLKTNKTPYWQNIGGLLVIEL